MILMLDETDCSEELSTDPRPLLMLGNLNPNPDLKWVHVPEKEKCESTVHYKTVLRAVSDSFYRGLASKGPWVSNSRPDALVEPISWYTSSWKFRGYAFHVVYTHEPEHGFLGEVLNLLKLGYWPVIAIHKENEKAIEKAKKSLSDYCVGRVSRIIGLFDSERLIRNPNPIYPEEFRHSIQNFDKEFVPNEIVARDGYWCINKEDRPGYFVGSFSFKSALGQRFTSEEVFEVYADDWDGNMFILQSKSSHRQEEMSYKDLKQNVVEEGAERHAPVGGYRSTNPDANPKPFSTKV